jgi:hypothetical protein
LDQRGRDRRRLWRIRAMELGTGVYAITRWSRSKMPKVSKIAGPLRVQSLLTCCELCTRARYIAKVRENCASSENCEIPRNKCYRETRMPLVSATPTWRTVRYDRSVPLGARIDRQTSGHRRARESGSESSPSKKARRYRRLQAFGVCNLRDPRAIFMRCMRGRRNDPGGRSRN